MVSGIQYVLVQITQDGRSNTLPFLSNGFDRREFFQICERSLWGCKRRLLVGLLAWMKGYPDPVGCYNQHDGDRNHDTPEDRPRDVGEGQTKTLNGKKK